MARPNNADRNAKTRPIYTPKTKIKNGLYTEGKELMFAETLKEYIGLYHKYPNGAVYSEAGYNTNSKLLMAYTSAIEPAQVKDVNGRNTGVSGSFNNSIYHQITGARFNKHKSPEYFYPQPRPKDYRRGSFLRYFAVHVSNPNSILEISPFMFDNINDNNEGGIDSRIYKTTSLSWTITGPVRDVQKTNLRMIQFHEQRVPGLQRYLTDLDEFHQKRHAIAEEDLVDNLYTDGGEYILSDGSAYVGDYHIHPNRGAMVGAVHSDEPHERLYPLTSPEDELTAQSNLFTRGGEYLLPNGREYRGPYHVHPVKGAMVGAEHNNEPHQILTPISRREQLGIIGGFSGGAY